MDGGTGENSRSFDTTVVISERQFAHGFGSFWRQILPDTDRFVRKLNLTRNRFDYEVDNVASPERRGMINEAAFLLTAAANAQGVLEPLKIDLRDSLVNEAVSHAASKVALLDGREPVPQESVSLDERREILFLVDSTYSFIREMGWSTSEFEFSPRFKGCGFLNECIGDLLGPNAMVEIKAGDRSFRSADIRQALVYVVLHYASEGQLIENIVLMNPRSGTYSLVSVVDMCRGMGGESAESVIRELINFLCGMSLSR